MWWYVSSRRVNDSGLERKKSNLIRRHYKLKQPSIEQSDPRAGYPPERGGQGKHRRRMSTRVKLSNALEVTAGSHGRPPRM